MPFYYCVSSAYGNTEQDDLWAALNQQAAADGVFLPAPVKTIMDTWTLKMGYPLINVTRNYDTSSITMTQERFLLRKSNDSSDTTVYQWVSNDFILSRPFQHSNIIIYDSKRNVFCK